MDNAIYKSRRINLSEKLPKNSVLLIPGANTQYRNADSAYAFRQDSNFYYLSGFCEPDSLMAIINNDDGINSIIFVPPKDKLKEIWDGHRSGPIGAVKEFLFDKAYDNSEIDNMMPEILFGCDQVLYPIGKKNGFDQKVIDWTTEASSKDRHSKSINILDASSTIGNARLIKDDHEISLIKKACDISAEAHIEAMKNVKNAESEQSIESLYVTNFQKEVEDSQPILQLLLVVKMPVFFIILKTIRNLIKMNFFWLMLVVNMRCMLLILQELTQLPENFQRNNLRYTK